MALNFSTTGQLAAANGTKVLTYAESSRGKTRMILTAPNPFVINADKGTLSIAGANLSVAVVNNLADLEDVCRWVSTSHEARQFQTICLDSITTIADAVLSDMKVKRAKDKDPRLAYGDMADEVLKHVRAFRDLNGFNVYVIAEMEYRKDGTKGPASPGQKVGAKFDYIFDEVFYLDEYFDPQTSARTTFLRTQSSINCIAKDRSGKLAEFEPADLSYIFNKIASS
jgi:hypothetical protein